MNETGILIFILFVLIIVNFVALWKIFEKANQPGWASLIPIYNFYVLTKVAQAPQSWTILLLIPILNVVFLIWTWNRIAKRFKKDPEFTLGIVFLGFIYIPMLAFSNAQYKSLGYDFGYGTTVINN